MGGYYEIIYQNNILDPKKERLRLRHIICFQLRQQLLGQRRAGIKLHFLLHHWCTGITRVATRVSYKLIIHRMKKGPAAFFVIPNLS